MAVSIPFDTVDVTTHLKAVLEPNNNIFFRLCMCCCIDPEGLSQNQSGNTVARAVFVVVVLLFKPGLHCDISSITKR